VFSLVIGLSTEDPGNQRTTILEGFSCC